MSARREGDRRSQFPGELCGIRQEPRAFVTDDDQGLLLCTWPRGGRPAVPTQYSDEVWTGMEYEVAALLLQEGEPGLALKLVEAVRRRYDGRKQNPWNDIECGDHYVRAMSSWSLLEAASGYVYDAPAGTIGFAPAIAPEDFRAPFVARDGWGTVEQTIAAERLILRLRPVAGSVQVASLRLRPPTPMHSCSATHAGQSLATELVSTAGEVTVVLAEPATFESGEVFEVTLTA